MYIDQLPAGESRGNRGPSGGTAKTFGFIPPDVRLDGIFVNTSTHSLEAPGANQRFLLTGSNVEAQTHREVRYCLPGIGIGVEFVGIRPEAVEAIDREIRASYRTRSRKT